MSFLAKLTDWAQRVLLPLGSWGLFAAAVLDSSFLSLPNVVDVWVISLTVAHPARMPFYVVVAAVGSVIGSCALYTVARKGGDAILKKIKHPGMARVRQWVERHGALAILVAPMLPPPTPLKSFVIAAGVLKVPLKKFALALFAGRIVRYSVEGILAVRYGRQVWEWLLAAGPIVILGVVAGVTLLLLGGRIRRMLVPENKESECSGPAAK